MKIVTSADVARVAAEAVAARKAGKRSVTISGIAFPTPVGVNRMTLKSCTCASSIPHTCGGEPIVLDMAFPVYAHSPHLWG